ncbi:DUF3581 family protein [Parashewanella spongiae]|uniref:DUF3581 family protein n=1 Tax=Parashewanella spongiae TaxID=342950 RepID=A0A3A6ULG3_9GAMM|nr:DUF3581 domain-containing protein [Parashewanella spongiae]MCL1076700.1 DUF3581 domain-containing protein [Parashewanella spongiae]RJY18508.1 DUF3581 family protein [Parashewanella spongiae]
MFLSPYFSKNQQSICVSGEQASDFAKKIAKDFNPIHDVAAKRFCVPGDLLFALVLNEYGLSQQMKFSFSGMVGDSVELQFPNTSDEDFSISDNKDKPYLNVKREGNVEHDQAQIEAFIRSYVAFSGHNFTQVLVPLMKEHQVMINPARPLVIYESMSFHLNHFEFSSIELQLVKSELKVDGKRGDVTLLFELCNGDKIVGSGEKTLVLSGLRAYEEKAMHGMCDLYEQRFNQFMQVA